MSKRPTIATSTQGTTIHATIAPVTNRRSVLMEAADLVDGDRNNQYGDPIGDFRCTADMWAAYLRRKTDIPAEFTLDPHDVAAMMSLLKISRIGWDHGKRDSWADLAGYAACGYDCAERENG
jgi:hypothetical protein